MRKQKDRIRRRLLVDESKWNSFWMLVSLHTLWAYSPTVCPQLEGSLLSEEMGWSMQTLIWKPSEGITVYTLPQCEWLGPRINTRGRLLNIAIGQQVCVPPPTAGKHKFGSFTSLWATNTHPPSLTHCPWHIDAPRHMTKLICSLEEVQSGT